MSKKIVLFLGDDDVFFDELNIYCKNIGIIEHNEFLVKNISFKDINWENETFNFTFDVLPHLIIMDFSRTPIFESAKAHLIELLYALKKHHFTKNIPLFGIFGSKEELLEEKYLIGTVLVYAQVKNDNRTMFRDSIYIAFDGRIPFPQYALARGINLFYDIKIPSIVSVVGVDSLRIETDVELHPEGKVRAKIPLFTDYAFEEFNVKDFNYFGLMDNFLFNATIVPKYPGPWDDIDEKSVQKSTVETWYSLNYDEFWNKADTCLLLNEDFSNYKDVFKLQEKSEFFIQYASYLDVQFSAIRATFPRVIVYNFVEFSKYSQKDFKDLKITPNDLDGLAKLINFVKITDEYKPVIILFNSPSNTESVQKVFEYSHLMCIQKPFCINLVSQLLQSFLKCKGSSEDKTSYMRPNDTRRCVDVINEIFITSLTEHEITFKTRIEYPLYSVMKIDVPVNAYITLVPPFKELSVEGGQNHYMGFIHSVTEEDLQILRQFVNRIIYKPIEKFEFNVNVNENKPLPVPENATGSNVPEKSSLAGSTTTGISDQMFGGDVDGSKKEGMVKKQESNKDDERFHVNRIKKKFKKSKL